MNQKMTNSSPTLAATDAHEHFERIDRYQTLQPGLYWRSVRAVANAAYIDGGFRRPKVEIREGLTLLLLNVRMFDGAAHTVELLEHPSTGTGTYQVLVNDFLDAFEPAPDGDAVREREIAAVHERVTAIQQELIDAQTDSAIIDAHVAEEMAKLAKKDPSLADSSRTDVTISRGAVTPATFIAARAGTEIAVSMQGIAKRQHAIANIKGKWLKARTDAISSTLQQLSPFYAEKAQVALARTRTIRDYADELMKSLRSLDLYVGTGVEVEQLADGESALETEQLTLMQRKLFMDEELAAWADVGANFDFTKIEHFDAAIAANAALRDQIFPFPRAVVSMAVRRRERHYENAYESAAKNEINRRVFLLVRDGDKIYRVCSTQPSHERAARLFPTQNEMGELFRGYDGERISFTDLQFTDRADAADDLSLGYKRMLILLCGLDHRLGLFGPFYPEAEALSFISLDFQKRHMRFIADDDEGLLLAGTARAIPVNEWMVRANSHLRSGSRVFCRWKSLLTPETAPGMLVRDGDYVDTRADVAPEEGVAALKIAYRDGKDICVDIQAVRVHDANASFNAKINLNGRSFRRSASLESRGLSSGYLCLDAVTASEVEHYVHSRADRVNHTGYIRLFKRASALLRADERAEADARKWLIDSVQESAMFQGQEASFAQGAVHTAIVTWRAANRGAALPELANKKALEGILDLVYRDAQSATLLSRITAFAEANGHVLLRAALSGKNKALLYCAPTAADRSPYTGKFQWVKRYTLDVLKTRLSVVSEKWVWLQRGAHDAAEQILHDSTELANWLNDAAEPCTVRGMGEAKATIEASISQFRHFFADVPADGLDADRFRLLFKNVIDQTFARKYIQEAEWHIPVGYIWDERELSFVCAEINAVPWLYRFATVEQRSKFESGFVGRHAHQEAGRARLLAKPQVKLGRVAVRHLDATGLLPLATRGWSSAQRAFSSLFTRRQVGNSMFTEVVELSSDEFLSALSQSEHGQTLWLPQSIIEHGTPAISHLIDTLATARMSLPLE